ncbi:MAG: VWA domain-containing protein [Acidobacteria bacterium]|nr:VWA domain-containing protein [Acidobacteriota bacterium]
MTRLLLASSLTVAGLAMTAAQAQAPLFRATSEMVPVFVTVTDRDNRLVTTLTREQFTVLDNGRAQPLTMFDNSPQPVRLILMLDMSGSMTGNLPILREASAQLFSRLRPDDDVRLGTFGNRIEITDVFTNDRAALLAALPREVEPNAPTPLWRAVDQAIGTFGNESGRRVVLVLSDGKDAPIMRWGQKFIGQLDVVDRAQREDVMIYSVGLRSRSGRPAFAPPGGDLRQMMIDDLPDPGLGTAAEATGGGYFEIGPRDNLAAAFARVADELHSQYLMGFAPVQRDGKLHKLEVKVAAKDLEPRTRKNYRAPK